MQLWGGHSLAGSAACSAPALSQQSLEHAHTQTRARARAEGTHVWVCGQARACTGAHAGHSHSQARLWTLHTQTQRHKEAPPAKAGGKEPGEAGGPSPLPPSSALQVAHATHPDTHTQSQ